MIEEELLLRVVRREIGQVALQAQQRICRRLFAGAQKTTLLLLSKAF
jgi:hypothetical protein